MTARGMRREGEGAAIDTGLVLARYSLGAGLFGRVVLLVMVASVQVAGVRGNVRGGG